MKPGLDQLGREEALGPEAHQGGKHQRAKADAKDRQRRDVDVAVEARRQARDEPKRAESLHAEVRSGQVLRRSAFNTWLRSDATPLRFDDTWVTSTRQ